MQQLLDRAKSRTVGQRVVQAGYTVYSNGDDAAIDSLIHTRVRGRQRFEAVLAKVRESVAALVLLSAAGTLIWAHGWLSATAQVILWAGSLLLLAFLSRRGGFKLLGPLLF